MQNRRYKISAIFLWSERAEKNCRQTMKNAVEKRRILLSKNVKIRCRYLLYFAVGKRRILLSKSVVICRRKTSDFTVEKCCNMPSENVGK